MLAVQTHGFFGFFLYESAGNFYAELLNEVFFFFLFDVELYNQRF